MIVIVERHHEDDYRLHTEDEISPSGGWGETTVRGFWTTVVAEAETGWTGDNMNRHFNQATNDHKR